jgi:hypothetical protein
MLLPKSTKNLASYVTLSLSLGTRASFTTLTCPCNRFLFPWSINFKSFMWSIITWISHSHFRWPSHNNHKQLILVGWSLMTHNVVGSCLLSCDQVGLWSRKKIGVSKIVEIPSLCHYTMIIIIQSCRKYIWVLPNLKLTIPWIAKCTLMTFHHKCSPWSSRTSLRTNSLLNNWNRKPHKLEVDHCQSTYFRTCHTLSAKFGT